MLCACKYRCCARKNIGGGGVQISVVVTRKYRWCVCLNIGGGAQISVVGHGETWWGTERHGGVQRGMAGHGKE